jgi:uncharacterized protein YdeI (YjbR/CyaY-like superfamily)
MSAAGQATVDLAKANGSWDMLADAQNTVIPWDLQKNVRQEYPGIREFSAFFSFFQADDPGMDH